MINILKKYHVAITLFVVGFVVFGNSLTNKFVWDDRTFIEFNSDVHSLNIGYLAGPNMFNNVNAGQYRFLVAFYFAVLHKIFGNNPFGYHMISIVLHVTNSLLVYCLLKRFFSKNISILSSLIFLVHPMQVESVAYIAAAGNPLFTFFGLTALLIKKNKMAIFSLLLLSLLSKETGIVFVILVILQKYINSKKELWQYLGYTAVTLGIYSVMRFFVAGVYFSKVHLAPITRIGLWERLLNVPAVIFYYLKTLVSPKDLIVEQYWIVTQLDSKNFYLPLLICIVVLILTLGLGWYVKKNKNKLFNVWLFFSIWTGLGLGMYSQIFSLDMTVADRWFYFPMVGISGLLALICDIWLIRKSRMLQIVFGVILIGFSARTMIRNTDWKDPITLYSHDAKVMDNYDLENSLGAELNILGRTQEALPHFQKSVKLFPHETNLFNLGLAFENLGNLEQAENNYEKALNSPSFREVPKPHKHHSVTYERLAILVLKHDPEKTLVITKDGLSDYPNSAQLWYTKALAEYKINNIEEAINSAKNAYILLPDNPNTKNLYQQLTQKKQVTIN